VIVCSIDVYSRSGMEEEEEEEEEERFICN
jgi:hypothetical protein